MAARPMKHGLHMGRPDDYVGRPVDLTGLAGLCVVPYQNVHVHTTLTLILNFNCWFSLFFPVWIPWDSCFRPMRDIASTHYSHNPAPPTTRSDGFLRATTSSCWCNTRCCCNTRCYNTLRAKITPAQAVIFWRRLPTLQQRQSPSPVRHRHT